MLSLPEIVAPPQCYVPTAVTAATETRQSWASRLGQDRGSPAGRGVPPVPATLTLSLPMRFHIRPASGREPVKRGPGRAVSAKEE